MGSPPASRLHCPTGQCCQIGSARGTGSTQDSMSCTGSFWGSGLTADRVHCNHRLLEKKSIIDHQASVQGMHIDMPCDFALFCIDRACLSACATAVTHTSVAPKFSIAPILLPESVAGGAMLQSLTTSAGCSLSAAQVIKQLGPSPLKSIS